MGDPRRTRKKFEGPSHPWQRERIEVEKELLKEYGLVNKSEVWKSNSKLKNFSGQAKRLIATRGSQSELEAKQLITKLSSLGLVSSTAPLGEVLGLDVKKLLNRRLQTLLVRNNLARTPKQARQFITHGHVSVSGKKITSPSHLVRVKDEHTIAFVEHSSLVNESHPERVLPQVAPVEVKEEASKSKGKKASTPDLEAIEDIAVVEPEALEIAVIDEEE